MCHQCDYENLLESAGISATEKRIRVLEVIGNNTFPLSAGDIHTTLTRSGPVDRVTVYRILDLLVDHALIERLSTGGRSFHYGLAPNDHHRRHPHFYCTKCGKMDCLNPGSLTVDTSELEKTFPGQIDKIEVRVDGICRRCMM